MVCLSAGQVFRPAYGDRLVAGVSMRVMNDLCFLNTKLLFKRLRWLRRASSWW